MVFEPHNCYVTYWQTQTTVIQVLPTPPPQNHPHHHHVVPVHMSLPPASPLQSMTASTVAADMGHTTSTYSNALLLEQQLTDAITYNTLAPKPRLYNDLLNDYHNLQYNTDADTGVDTNAYLFYSHGYTILHIAVLSNLPLTKLLLTHHNADVNCQSKSTLHTHTVSELQCRYHLYRTQYDSSTDDSDKMITPPYYDHCDLKASVKYTDLGYTPLMLTIIFTTNDTLIDTVDTLLLHGCDIQSNTSHTGLTPLMLACRRAHAQLIDTLLDAGCTLNAEDNQGFTAIEHSVQYSSTAVDVLSRVLNERQYKTEAVCDELNCLPDTVLDIILLFTSLERT